VCTQSKEPSVRIPQRSWMKLWKLLWKLLGKGKSQRNSKVGSKLPNQKQPLQREDAKFKTSFSPF
jgi:hypothetical protein